jgi:hypothetical protein
VNAHLTPTNEDKPSSPAHPEAAIARDVLEKALFEVQRSTARMDRAQVTESFSRALDALAALAKSHLDDDDHLDKVEAAKAAMMAVHAALVAQKQPVLDTLAADVTIVHDALAASVRRVIDSQGIRRAPNWRVKATQPNLLPFRASSGSAALLRVERGPLVAPVRLLVPEEDLIEVDEIPLNDDADEDEVVQEKPIPPAPLPIPIDDPDRAGALGEEATLRRLARELMEEVGTLGALCSPGPARAWTRGIVAFEERLLAAFDALIALGQPIVSIEGTELVFDVLGDLVAHSNAAEGPDPARAFARTFVLSCVEGEDRVRAAVVAMEQAHSATYPAHRDAFILGSSPSIGPAMRKLCEHAPAPILRVALDVLAARREASVAGVAPLLEHPDAGVRIRAVRCLAVANERNAAIAMLAQVIGEETDTRVVAAAMRALVRRGEPYGLESARQALRNNRTDQGELHTDARLDLLELLGIAGNATDGPTLQAALAYRPREAEALGWHGSPGHVEALLAALQNAESTPGKKLFCAGIARALVRITGANIIDASGDPLPDPRVWTKYWAENRAKFTTTLRYRFGRPYLPMATLDELSTDGTIMADRENCVLELDAITAGGAELDLRRWTASVDAGVNRLQSIFGDKPRHADGSGFSAGEWVSSRWLRRGAV